MELQPNHFRPNLTIDEAEELFKNAVETIEISISSYCNRRCPYCPNSLVDRISAKNFMSDGLFLNVMRQLCKIEYAGGIHINRYNEPLADKDYALKRISEIRAFLPKSSIAVFTNGDYLDAAYVTDLGEAGVFQIYMTIHEAAGGTSFPDLLLDQDRRLSKLGLPFSYAMNPAQNRRVANVDTGSAMLFYCLAQDFHARDGNGVLWMQDRGQSLAVEKGMIRSAPCFMPFAQMQIEWDGELLPCCQIQPDAFAKNQYSLGRLTENSNIFLEWTNVQYVQWRKDLFSYEIKKSPCSTCSYGGKADPPPDFEAFVNDYRKRLQLAGYL
ncbi:MAG: SPASM domain-containing protein [Beijerinckiaceae bacterium]